MKVILLYHNITKNNKVSIYDVDFDLFRRHLQLLKNNVSSKDIVHNILLSFDDGYKSWATEVLELLITFNIKGVFFICIENIKRGFIREKDILRLKEAGMFIGSHSLNHCFLPFLPLDKLYYELQESKRILEDITGCSVDWFSIPRGVYNHRIIEVAKDVGYIRVFTSDIGFNEYSDYVLKRIPLKRKVSDECLSKIIEGKLPVGLLVSQKLKDIFKSLLGIRFYNFIRKTVTGES